MARRDGLIDGTKGWWLEQIDGERDAWPMGH